jgi:hypothetical protein
MVKEKRRNSFSRKIFLGMVIFHGSPEKFDANNMLAKLQDETEKRMQAEKQLRELERQISLSKTYIQRTQQSSPYHDRPKILN